MKTIEKSLKGSKPYLGKDEFGIKYYLEKPSWDCKWYWCFGYIQGYEGVSYQSREHADKFMSEWFTEWNGSKPRLIERTFDDKEGWELCELFKQFYHLKEQAGFWGRGNMHCANTTIQSWKNKKLAKEINEKMLPVVIDRIMGILSPKV